MSEKRKCNEIFINNLKYLMEYCNEKSDDLSTDLDLDTSTVNKYLSGRRTNIDDEYLTKIAIHYRCPKTVLLYGDVKKIYSQKREFEFEDLISIIRTPENIDAKSIDSKLVSDNEIIINKLKGPIFSNSVSASAFVDFIVDCKNTHKMLKVSYNKNKKLDVLIWVVWYELLISILSSFGFEKNDSEE